MMSDPDVMKLMQKMQGKMGNPNQEGNQEGGDHGHSHGGNPCHGHGNDNDVQEVPETHDMHDVPE